MTSLLCDYKKFVCPLEYSSETDSVNSFECEPSHLFKLKAYDLPRMISLLLPGFKVYMHPFQIHALALSIFASTIGPFGGFFASGFKRAFKIKDFGDTIPGHGGFMDRFDCQIIMATFTNVYIYTFIKFTSPSRLFNQLLSFEREDQLKFIKMVENHFGKHLRN